MSYIHSGFAMDAHPYSTSEEFYQHKNIVKNAEQDRALSFAKPFLHL